MCVLLSIVVVVNFLAVLPWVRTVKVPACNKSLYSSSFFSRIETFGTLSQIFVSLLRYVNHHFLLSVYYVPCSS